MYFGQKGPPQRNAEQTTSASLDGVPLLNENGKERTENQTYIQRLTNCSIWLSYSLVFKQLTRKYRALRSLSQSWSCSFHNEQNQRQSVQIFDSVSDLSKQVMKQEPPLSTKLSNDNVLMGNLLLNLFVDICFSCLFNYFIWKRMIISGDQALSFSETLASDLRQLILWMQGAPAGLKLNKELSSFMGNFFFYHIHLWLGYLTFIKPFLNHILIWLPCLGLFGGLSLQIAIISDLLSCLSLHVYCFYVYASRLFFFLFCGFSSLFRLFRGKKMNPLRNRIDSCQFDFAQLFVGTLTFTILLFLFPTCLTYYTVFTTLRLITLGFQLLIIFSVNQINSFPVYALLLRLRCSSYTSNGIEVSIVPAFHSSHSNVAFEVKQQQAPILDVYVMASKNLHGFFSQHEIQEQSCLKAFLSKICQGELIKL